MIKGILLVVILLVVAMVEIRAEAGFAPGMTVLLGDGIEKKVGEVKVGDKIATEDETTATVIDIQKTDYKVRVSISVRKYFENGKTELVFFEASADQEIFSCQKNGNGREVKKNMGGIRKNSWIYTKHSSSGMSVVEETFVVCKMAENVNLVLDRKNVTFFVNGFKVCESP